ITEEIEFLAGYTFSRTIDDASFFFEQPENPFDLHTERALSAQHQKHRLSFSALFELELEDETHSIRKNALNQTISALRETFGELEIAPIIAIGSGRPFSNLVGFDANQSGALPASSRALGNSRNALVGPKTVNVDLRVVRVIKFGGHNRLDLVVQA